MKQNILFGWPKPLDLWMTHIWVVNDNLSSDLYYKNMWLKIAMGVTYPIEPFNHGDHKVLNLYILEFTTYIQMHFSSF